MFRMTLLKLGLFVCAPFGLHYSFYKLTDKRKTIIPKEKYVKVDNGFSRFMIVDENNNHYTVSKLLWKCKFDNAEQYSSMEIGKSISAHYYGFRFPFFRIYPHIYMTCTDIEDCIQLTEKNTCEATSKTIE